MSISLLLQCHDVQITKSFYEEILEFDVFDSDDNTCTVEKDGAQIKFTSDNLSGEYPQCTGIIYFFVDDVENYYNSIKEKAIIKWPIETTNNGIREFGVKDYNEYTLAFAQKV